VLFAFEQTMKEVPWMELQVTEQLDVQWSMHSEDIYCSQEIIIVK
jgi:hypothetical protein